MTGGSMKKKANTFFGRKQEMEELARGEAAAREESERIARDLAAQAETNAALSEALSASREAWQALHVENAAAAGRREGLASALSAAQAAASAASAARAAAEAARKTHEEQASALRKERGALGDIPALPEEAELAALRAAADRAAQAAADQRVALARAEEALRRADDQVKAKAAAADAEQTGRKQAEDALEKRRGEDAAMAEALAALSAQYDRAKAAQQAAADARDRARDEADQIALGLSGCDKARRAAQDAAVELDKKLAERALRIEEQKRLEAEETARLQLAGFTEETAEAQRLPGNMQDMQARLGRLKEEIGALGPVNPNAEAEYALEEERLQSYRAQVEDLEKARDGLQQVIRGIDEAMASHFTEAFGKINEEFGRIMRLMFRGGAGRLALTDAAHPLESGVELYLELPGKKRQPLSLMSGGERALTVIALLISFLAYRPAPFCFVDEIDAALDDANVERFARMMEEYKKRAQFIVITHRKKTMEFADTLQGVTMGEKGVSALVTVRMEDYIKEE